jgi:hypothetical protein
MKRLLIALAAVLFCTAANADELWCSAPQMLVSHDVNDPNPVVNTWVNYEPEYKSWTVTHTLLNGREVDRSQQYMVGDLSNFKEMKWSGYLARNRALYMVGQVWIDGQRHVHYDETLYDTNHGNRVDMHSSAICAPAQGRLRSDPVEDRPLEEVYQVPSDISGGRLNMRNGPGVNYALVGAVPAGSVLRGKAPIQCRPREDGIKGADWCHIAWNGVDGWVSKAGMMPIN